MTYYVYVLKSSKDGRLYKGLSADVNVRAAQHNAGKVKATRAFRPWVLVYQEQFDTLAAARERERFPKSGYGRSFLKAKGL